MRAWAGRCPDWIFPNFLHTFPNVRFILHSAKTRICGITLDTKSRTRYSPPAMTCAIIGDSIALGLALAMPECASKAVVGASSGTIRSWSLPECYDFAVISAGSNDPRNPALKRNLRAIRAGLCARRVLWIFPANLQARRAVQYASSVFGDSAMPFLPAKDGVHPRSYKSLARSVKLHISS